MDLDLSGKVAVVTGVSKGIASLSTRALVAEGAPGSSCALQVARAPIRRNVFAIY
jgi:NAD(P)-dependent dehydrogenase (short-subunit alcohol dehydrogenase family)